MVSWTGTCPWGPGARGKAALGPLAAASLGWVRGAQYDLQAGLREASEHFQRSRPLFLG